jgi:hypothetical protein
MEILVREKIENVLESAQYKILQTVQPLDVLGKIICEFLLLPLCAYSISLTILSSQRQNFEMTCTEYLSLPNLVVGLSGSTTHSVLERKKAFYVSLPARKAHNVGRTIVDRDLRRRECRSGCVTWRSACPVRSTGAMVSQPVRYLR